MSAELALSWHCQRCVPRRCVSLRAALASSDAPCAAACLPGCPPLLLTCSPLLLPLLPAVKCDENGDALEGAEPLRVWTVSERRPPAAALPPDDDSHCHRPAHPSVPAHCFKHPHPSAHRPTRPPNRPPAVHPRQAQRRPLRLHPLCPPAQQLRRRHQPAALRLAAPPRPRAARGGQLVGCVAEGVGVGGGR